MKKEFINILDNASLNDVFLVAVSGGPDSMALLHKLTCYKNKFVVCHVNYKTRNESDYEENMVRSFCENNNIIFEYSIVKENNITNFQDSARVFRYSFFKEMYNKYDAKALIVAHHLDDSLETYLMQKERKSIVRHYGIAFESFIMNMKVLRPLLCYRKKELLEYCDSNNVPYSVDYTNNIPKYQRNKIRLDVINQLSDEGLNKLVEEMNINEQENVKLFNNIEKYFNKCVSNNRLDIEKFSLIDENYQSLVLYMFLEDKIYRSSKVLSKSYLKDLCIQIQDGKSNKQYTLDKKYILYQEYGFLHVEEAKEIEYCYYLDKGEYLSTEYFSIAKSGDNKNGIYISDDEYPIMIRNYRDGDEIILENGHKKLRRWFIDKKTPLSKRKKIPLLFTKQGRLVFIPSLYKDFERKNLKSTLFMIE